MKLQPGKAPLDFLQSLLDKAPVDDPLVTVGPHAGQDAAVIDLGGQCLVAKSDPITFAAERIGWYAVQINANDVACMGARPRWFLAVLLVPPRLATKDWINSAFDDLAFACRDLDISLIGGHTEITPGIDSPILSGSMLGLTTPDRLIDKSAMRPGDSLVLARGVAIEGTAIIALERPETARAVLGDDGCNRARNFIYEPGIGVSALALAASRCPGVTALHDPTEGGLYGGIAELALGYRLGVSIDQDAIPIYPETAALCQHYRFDPYKLIASGSLLIAVRPERESGLIDTIKAHGVEARRIGALTPESDGLWVRARGDEWPLDPPGADEITKLF